MNTLGKRLKDAITGLSPEEKARLAIEDIFRSEPVLSSPERPRLLDAMSNEEGRRYNAVLARYETVKRHVTALSRLVDALREQLLLRDRILWFHRALRELEDRLLFEPTTARALLVDNPNLRPGKPLTVELTLASVKLGVWVGSGARWGSPPAWNSTTGSSRRWRSMPGAYGIWPPTLRLSTGISSRRARS